MSETKSLPLSGVKETMLITLYLRAMESQRPDAIMKDEKAVTLVTQMSYDFDQVRKIRMNEGNKVARIMLTREMDRYARDFLSRHPEAVVVHIGCGLDSRFERVDNGQVEWYDLDLPDVIVKTAWLTWAWDTPSSAAISTNWADAWLQAAPYPAPSQSTGWKRLRCRI